MSQSPIIQFEHVNFQYESQTEPTLKDINFTIQKGEKVLIAGPSGSGKSTLGKILNGMIPEDYPGELSGNITINGQSFNDLDVFKLSFEVGTVLQDPDSQFVGLTVAEDIAFALENDAKPQSEIHQRVSDWAKRLDVAEIISNHPQDISGGQKQRVSLAGVLIGDEPILLLDEPLANLDPAAGEASIELLDHLSHKEDLTVIIIEHRIEEVLHRPIDRLLLIDDGKLIANDTPNQILKSGVLTEVGLREPLYLTALRACGIEVSELPEVDELSKIELPDNGTAVLQWDVEHPIQPNSDGAEPLLEIRNLQFNYPNRSIFNNFNLTINKGEMVAIVGKNGTGKTTLSNLITGFLHPNQGEIKLAGTNLDDLSIKERAEHIGYILQDPNQMISKDMIFDEVALGLRLRGLDEEIIKEKVLSTLKVTGLYPFRNWPIRALSFGQKKRVTIASILVLDPEVMILDEPTAGQDLAHYSEIMDFLEELNRTQQLTTIFITHDMYLMLEYADRAVALSDGEIIADTLPINVLTNDDVVKAASLTHTSLQSLGTLANLENPARFAQGFVDYQKEVRHHE
ncbi:ABC transporter ATP-binding protein [Pediococcus argentinicus]|uniref:ABC superfamily ATP binding cassette transporter, ABC protein n=1 Tax=Pediococcus argentinicus TaxID=480391 RepID=A0A0R2NGX3_9LACO|nr:ABC transporter ATP-binding protein [Pediococcus argentinicus]KRO24604.1 ABC superfamily ATP binding cassette transporter, ABC protein [Pediococcus argentinicus]NKZ22820.1 ABC transporter ATP-binding protein [Pediococcus argentinicus]GEP19840.1 putative ABC transporter ATP-binding protein [Pediococcus argentinicus]